MLTAKVDLTGFDPGTTAPLLAISRKFGVDYGDTLLFADGMIPNRARANPVHCAAGTEGVYNTLTGKALDDFTTLVEHRVGHITGQAGTKL